MLIVGIVSSGLPWATAVALRADRHMLSLRLATHRYGPQDQSLKRYRGAAALVVDNYFGSGDTMGRACALLTSHGIRVVDSVVVESADDSIRAVLTVRSVLSSLLRCDYFDELGREVVDRYLVQGDEWLADQEWVSSVVARTKTTDGVRR
jgi:orotate phosphoribosyltransferase